MSEGKGTWNHRVVRRYAEAPEEMRALFGEILTRCWLEITEVHYRDGKPEAFAIDLGAPLVSVEEDGEFTTDAERLGSLRWTLGKMLEALEQPILDERKDFA